MADFDIRDIAALKVKLQIIEKLVLADWILIILSMYYDWGGWITCLIVIQIILYIYKSKLRKQLKQKEYLAKVVEERTIELRIQRDQVLLDFLIPEHLQLSLLLLDVSLQVYDQH